MLLYTGMYRAISMILSNLCGMSLMNVNESLWISNYGRLVGCLHVGYFVNSGLHRHMVGPEF